MKAEIYKDLAAYFAEQKDYKNAYEYQLLHEQNLEKHTDQYNQEFYPMFKKNCDAYFWNTHRKEARGMGGLFFEYRLQINNLHL